MSFSIPRRPAAAGAVLALSLGAPAGSVFAQDLVIRGATVLTVTNGVLAPGAIRIENGRIAEVGASVEVPAGVEVIEADGMFVMPGIVDAHSHIAAESINEGSVAVSSMTGTGDVVDPYDIAIYRELAGGVTTSNILHGSANPIGGLNVVIKHRWGEDAEGLVFEGAPPGIKFALGENPKRSRGTPPGVERRYPATRMGVVDVIRRAFVEARAYRQAFRDYEAAKAAGRPALPPRRDLKLEPLVEILEGERMVHAHCYRQDEILQLLRVAEEFDFRIATLQHVLEGYKVADEIAEHGAGASTFSDWWAYKVEAYDAIPHNAALMAERGVLVSINSDSAEEARHLNQEAAKTVKWGGMTEEQALATITINAAIHLGIGDRVGSIEVGKDADLAVFDRHPLSTFAVNRFTVVDGEVLFSMERDREMREAMAAERAALEAKFEAGSESAARPGGRRAGGSPGRRGPGGSSDETKGVRR